MAAIVIDSPRWIDGWGAPLHQPPARPALRLVGAGTRRPDPALHRRRRLAVVVALGVALATALAVVSLLLTQPAVAGAVPHSRPTHLVEPGETYWSIAAAQHHGGDLRIQVDRLIDANGGRRLFAGDRIELP